MSKLTALIAITVLLVAGLFAHWLQQSYTPSMSGTANPSVTSPNGTVTIGGIWPTWTLDTSTAPPISCTSATIGGSLLLLGQCATGLATCSGATNGMTAVASPATAQPNGIQWQAYVSSANTVTVQACALATLTPASSVYNVRVLP